MCVCVCVCVCVCFFVCLSVCVRVFVHELGVRAVSEEKKMVKRERGEREMEKGGGRL